MAPIVDGDAGGPGRRYGSATGVGRGGEGAGKGRRGRGATAAASGSSGRAWVGAGPPPTEGERCGECASVNNPRGIKIVKPRM